jgi:hypothetical protein
VGAFLLGLGSGEWLVLRPLSSKTGLDVELDATFAGRSM